MCSQNCDEDAPLPPFVSVFAEGLPGTSLVIATTAARMWEGR